MQKARCHKTLLAPTACKHPVSGLFHPGTPGPFHLSLTVLFPIGLLIVCSLARWCWPIQRGFLRSPPTQDPLPMHSLTSTRLSLSAAAFPKAFDFSPVHFWKVLQPHLSRNSNGLGSSAFARHYLRNHSIIFCSCGYLDVSVHRVCPSPKVRSLCFTKRGCPIRIPADQPVPAGPRSVSSLATSFLAVRSQGIPRVLFSCVSFYVFITARPAGGSRHPRTRGLSSLLNRSKNK